MDYQDDSSEQINRNSDASKTQVPDLSVEDMSTETQTAPNPNISNRSKKLFMWLIVASPSTLRGTVLPIAPKSIIGRQGDIRWHDGRMSRKHAQFLLINDPENLDHKLFSIKPYKDRNGTLVNGKRISELTPLYENDVIVMGDTQFVVKVLL